MNTKAELIVGLLVVYGGWLLVVVAIALVSASNGESFSNMLPLYIVTMPWPGLWVWNRKAAKIKSSDGKEQSNG